MIRKLRKALFNYVPLLAKSGIIYSMPFLYRFLEIKPQSVVILITNRCNLRCVMCKQWQENPGEELSSEDWKGIMDDLYANGIRNIHFTGGEPLLRKDLPELTGYGFKKGFTVGMTTNGLLLKKDVLRKLLDAGMRSIALSVDAVGAEYEKLRGVSGAFNKVFDALAVIADAKDKTGMDAYINFTLMRDTMSGFREVKVLADKFGLPVALCLLDKNSSIFEVKANKDSLWISGDNDLKALDNMVEFVRKEKARSPRSILTNFSEMSLIGEYFNDPVLKKIPCISSQDRIFVDPYGNLLGGCLSMGSFGNLKDRHFIELAGGERYKKAKKNMFYKKCQGCSCGYSFNIKHFVPFLVKHRISRLERCKTKN